MGLPVRSGDGAGVRGAEQLLHQPLGRRPRGRLVSEHRSVARGPRTGGAADRGRGVTPADRVVPGARLEGGDHHRHALHRPGRPPSRPDRRSGHGGGWGRTRWGWSVPTPGSTWPPPLLHGEPRDPGRVAVVSQSGTVSADLALELYARGVGLSTFLGVGDQYCLTASGSIRALADDDHSDAVIVYLEDPLDGQDFRAALGIRPGPGHGGGHHALGRHRGLGPGGGLPHRRTGHRHPGAGGGVRRVGGLAGDLARRRGRSRLRGHKAALGRGPESRGALRGRWRGGAGRRCPSVGPAWCCHRSATGPATGSVFVPVPRSWPTTPSIWLSSGRFGRARWCTPTRSGCWPRAVRSTRC